MGSGETEIWRLPNGGLNKPRDCPQLPASSYRPAVTGQESNHRKHRNHGTRACFFPWFPCIPWFKSHHPIGAWLDRGCMDFWSRMVHNSISTPTVPLDPLTSEAIPAND